MEKKILISTVSIFILFQIVSVSAAGSCKAGKLDLKLRLKPGQKYGMQLITELKRTETMEDRQENESFMYAKGMDFEVKEVDANSVASVEVTCRTLQMKVIRAGGYRMEYDSTKQSIVDDYSKIPAIQAAGVGESFVIKVTPKSKVIEIRGIEQMHSRMIEKINAWDEKYLKMEFFERHKESLKELRRHNIQSSYSKNKIKNMLSNIITAFPERHVGIGESWVDRVKIWGKNYEIDGTYTLKESAKGTVAIDLRAERTAEESPFSWVNNKGRKVGFKIVGSCEGRFEVDQQTGWLVRSKIKMRFTGEVIDEEADNRMTKPILKEEVITVEPME